MKNFKKNSLIVLILIISISGIVLPKNLINLDEIWNYNFAKCIAEGLLPYKDFNMIQTPLLPIICGLILKVTANELLVMRILAIILITACLFTIYKIFEKLCVHKYIINIFVIGIYLLLRKYFCIDYNWVVLLITLITIFCELKNDIFEQNFKKDFLLGILVGTSILFKQTTGLVLTIIFILYKLLQVSNKKELKTVFRIISHRMLGCLLPILVLAAYLTINNIWMYFMDYTIYSINIFSNKKPYILLLLGEYGVVMQLLSILVPITILIMYYLTIYKKINTKEQKNIFILFCYSIASIVVVYPISDSIHFLIGAMPSLIAFCYLMYIWINEGIRKSKKNNQTRNEIKYFMKAFGFLSIIAILVFSSLNIIKYINIAKNFKNLKHFKYIPRYDEQIYIIDNYIIEQENKGKKVYILNASAAYYLIPLDIYHKDFDMFVKGNIGSKGEEGLIQKLKKENENTIVLVLNDNYERNWQTPERVIKYVKENWKKHGEISIFDIYKLF